MTESTYISDRFEYHLEDLDCWIGLLPRHWNQSPAIKVLAVSSMLSFSGMCGEMSLS